MDRLSRCTVFERKQINRNYNLRFILYRAVEARRVAIIPVFLNRKRILWEERISLNVKRGGTYSNHWALKGNTYLR
jgi:hypothetical protein